MSAPLSRAAANDALLAAVRRSDLRACARLISRIESADESVAPILEALYAEGGQTPVIGITGPPGVGKSTLVDELIAHYRARQLRVSVLAVDPSSPFSGGAILGDRVRMSRHNADSGVFIRSMSARGSLGGLARATGDVLVVLDAMRPDVILVETVGVGQNEIDIMQYARTVVILQPPAAGDAVQAIKAGMLEIGDVFAVSKARAPGAHHMVSMLREAVDFRSRSLSATQWKAPILKIEAKEREGVDELARAIEEHGTHLGNHPAELAQRLRRQARARLLELVSEGLRRHYQRDEGKRDFLERMLDDVVARKRGPHAAAERILRHLSAAEPTD